MCITRDQLYTGGHRFCPQCGTLDSFRLALLEKRNEEGRQRLARELGLNPDASWEDVIPALFAATQKEDCACGERAAAE